MLLKKINLPVITGLLSLVDKAIVRTNLNAFRKVAAIISVKDDAYNALGDNATDDTAAVTSAVAAAFAAGSDLYWPTGTYVTTTSIPNFHSVRHVGPGIVKRNTQLFAVQPTPSQANIIWVDATGSDTNDGLSSNYPVKEIKTAVALLDNYDGASGAIWTIQATAGTYKGGILVPRGWGNRNFIKIKGAVAVHPNASTTVIDLSADVTATYGVLASDGTQLWLENIKINGAFTQGVYIARNAYLQWVNVHVVSALTGLQANVHCRYFVTGGKISNCVNYGINELFHITRSFDTVASSAEQLIIEFAGKTGLKAKENCVGHLDYLNIQDCPVGVEFQLFSGANTSGLELKRCSVGIVLVNSELHVYAGIVWGSGADTCTRRIKRIGNSSIIDTFGWAPDGGVTQKLGQAPLVKIGQNYTSVTVTGTTTETNVRQYTSILKQDIYCVEGSKLTFKLWGRTGAGGALIGNVRLLLRLVSIFATDVTLPAGTPANAFFMAEFDVICTADGNNQIVMSKLIIEGGSAPIDVTMIDRTIDLAGGDRTVLLSCIPANAGDSVSVWGTELYG